MNRVTLKNMLTSILVNGKTDRALLNDLVGKLPARDSKALRHYIDAHEPGIDMTQEVTCSKCDHIEEVAIPIGVSFFWPQS